MEPIPETVEALRELTRFGDDMTARTLWRISSSVEEIVPDVAGLSLTLVVDGLTFTMTATNRPVVELDAWQYLDGGPCDTTMHTGEHHAYRAGDAVDEDRWHLFARATSAAGIRSTLSLPILRDGVVVAGVNVYGSTPDAFDGHHEEVAEVCGAWAAGAVTNADLGFATRSLAVQAPQRLRDSAAVDRAVGTLMARWEISVEEAESRLREAARRAGLADADMARMVLRLLLDPPDAEGLEGTADD